MPSTCIRSWFCLSRKETERESSTIRRGTRLNAQTAVSLDTSCEGPPPAHNNLLKIRDVPTRSWARACVCAWHDLITLRQKKCPHRWLVPAFVASFATTTDHEIRPDAPCIDAKPSWYTGTSRPYSSVHWYTCLQVMQPSPTEKKKKTVSEIPKLYRNTIQI